MRCGRIVDIAWVLAHLCRLSLVGRLLAHVLMMGMVDGCIIRYFLVLCVHCASHLVVVVERLFAGLLQGEVSTVGHLLRLVVLLGGQALDKLVVFLDLLLVVLHRLQLQIHRASIFKRINKTIKFKLLQN